LRDLSKSIKKNGVLQPILVKIEQGKTIRLVAGERRLRASKLAKQTNIPAIITSGNPIEIALIENLQREDLKPIEEAEALAKIKKEANLKQSQLAEMLNKSRPAIVNILSINKLPEKIKKECQTSDISKSILIELVKVKDKDEQLKLWENIKKNNISVKTFKERQKVKKQKLPIQTEIQKVILSGQRFLKKLTSYTDNETSLKSEEIEHLKELKTAIKNILNKVEEKK